MENNCSISVSCQWLSIRLMWRKGEYGCNKLGGTTYSVSILMKLGVPPKFKFFILQWANLIGPLQKKVETMEAPQNRRLYGEMECVPLWPTYLGENGRTLGKTYGIKVRRCWEHPLGNTLGTYWESDEDPLGTSECSIIGAKFHQISTWNFDL
jgi:hypothetical protein